MKNSKRIFAIFSAITVTVCLCLLMFRPGQADNDPSSSTESTVHETFTPAPIISTPATDATELDLSDVEIPTIPTETFAPIELGSNVTVQQVEKDPNEIIDRSQTIDPTDPEYIPVTGGDPYFNMEGKVCRNDKVISITLYDAQFEDAYKISFGYITATCNRFLYLNPVIERNGTQEDAYIHFTEPLGGGYLVTLSGENTDTTDPAAYTYFRARDQRSLAQFTDPRHPGAVWFPQSILDGPIYLDMIISNASGNLISTLRLTVFKSEDGTYALADIDSLNLLHDNTLHPEYTAAELEYVVQTANTAWLDPSLTHLNDSSAHSGFTAASCIIELREQHSGLYYSEFIPTECNSRITQDYSDLGFPILAVTYRQTNITSHTLYFLVISPPDGGQHGSYQYIGRDYPSFATTKDLEGYLWSGSG